MDEEYKNETTETSSITSESEDTTDTVETAGDETSSITSDPAVPNPDMPEEPEEDKKKKPPITKEGLRELIKLNIQGMTNQQIADKLNVSLSIVQKAISLIESLTKSDKPKKKRKQTITKKGIGKLIESNQKGLNNQEIAKKLNVSLSSVQKVINLINQAEPIPKGEIVSAPILVKTIEYKVQYVLVKHYNKTLPAKYI